MNGPELANELQAVHPQIKTLFMSGYTSNVIAHQGVLNAGVNFIQKPFSLRELALKIRAILNNTRT
jgi:two-component system cell cycle sensor histidine kinase/response regulator CckA